MCCMLHPSPSHCSATLLTPPPRVLMEEYGTARYSRKHSTFYKVMMEELGLNTSELGGGGAGDGGRGAEHPLVGWEGWR
jgi:hypothetical protein